MHWTQESTCCNDPHADSTDTVFGIQLYSWKHTKWTPKYTKAAYRLLKLSLVQTELNGNLNDGGRGRQRLHLDNP